jgi:hypothetical protein
MLEGQAKLRRDSVRARRHSARGFGYFYDLIVERLHGMR